MASVESSEKYGIWYEDPFHFIKPEEYDAFGIDPDDISPGTIPARRHPSYLPGRYGGNAYGLGLYELYDRLNPQELDTIQSISYQNQDELKQHYRKINAIYKKMGLLIRVSSHGKLYYLIPDQLIVSTINRIKIKADEIGRIIESHKNKYLKESYRIGVITQEDDIISANLSLRFKEHEFYIIDSLPKLINSPKGMDLVIFTRDIFEIIQAGRFIPLKEKKLTKNVFERYAIYLLSKIYGLLNEKGELFAISEYHVPLNDKEVKVGFKTEQEYKRFLFFTHIFKTKKRYRASGSSNTPIDINIFDLKSYLNQPYVEQKIIDRLLGKKELDSLKLEEIESLPFMDNPIYTRYRFKQYEAWNKVFGAFFEKLYLNEHTPQDVLDDWRRRVEFYDYIPPYILLFLGQKRPAAISIKEIKEEVEELHLSGSPSDLISEHRDSFNYLYETLNCLNMIKKGQLGEAFPEGLIQRLKQPFERPRRRHRYFNDVLKLMAKKEQIRNIEACLNPHNIEGPTTSILSKLELLQFFGFSKGELREIFLIVSGHSSMGQIIQGKTNLKAMKPFSDALRRLPFDRAIHILRYYRLMSVAEYMALKKDIFDLNQANEAFDIFELVLKSLVEKSMDWDLLIDSYITSCGGIRNVVIRNILKMMNKIRFLNRWEELSSKGTMEKETLADYDSEGVKEINSIITLINTVEELEERFLKEDPLFSPSFYRKFLNIEFHGTGTLFEYINSRFAYILLWIVGNVSEGNVVNFNPILQKIDFYNPVPFTRKIEKEIATIKLNHIDIQALRELREHLENQKVTFIMGTGLQLRLDDKRKIIHVDYIDMDGNISNIEGFLKRAPFQSLTDINEQELEELSHLFGDIEVFYQGHLRMIEQRSFKRFPKRQLRWIKRIENIRDRIKREFRGMLFNPQSLFTDMNRLYNYSKELFRFIFPEISALENLSYNQRDGNEHFFYILNSLKKFQALINHDKKSFHDVSTLHHLARREFGPMDWGILGLSDSQINELENIVEDLKGKRVLFSALIKALLFRDVGLIPDLRKRYEKLMNPVNHADAGVLFIEKENLAHEYGIDKDELQHMLKIIKCHDYLLHMVEGEFSLYAVKDILEVGDKDLFDAIFICSFIVFCSMSNDLILEDLMEQLMKIRRICHRILAGGITLDTHLQKVYARRGKQYMLLSGSNGERGDKGLISIHEIPPSSINYQAGRLIYGMERIFRLRGVKHVEFIDLANYLMNMPLRYIYKRRRYYGVGYSRFEKELFEAYRIYGTIMGFPEEIRHFILDRLVEDRARIWGFREVSKFLTYENQIRLLFLSLMGAERLFQGKYPVSINFNPISDLIYKRFELINDLLRGIEEHEIWDEPKRLNSYLSGKTALLIRTDFQNRVLSIYLKDKINIDKKLKRIKEIRDVDQLKNYYYYSLKSLRKYPYFTEDYELALERAYEKRVSEILEQVISKARAQMELMKSPKDVKRLRDELLDKALEMGLTPEQKNRINDIYELRQEEIKREKLREILSSLQAISDRRELKDYWDSIKWYLYENRPFLGKEFEILVAREFDKAYSMLS